MPMSWSFEWLKRKRGGGESRMRKTKVSGQIQNHDEQDLIAGDRAARGGSLAKKRQGCVLNSCSSREGIRGGLPEKSCE